MSGCLHVISTPKFTWSSCLTEIDCLPYFVSCLHAEHVLIILNCEYITNRRPTDAVLTGIVYIDEIIMCL